MPEQFEGHWLAALARKTFVPASDRCTLVVNPKSACSTLKLSIWRHEYAMGATRWPPPTAAIHRRENTALPKVAADNLESALFDKPVFSIVRNPYTRILSAY